MLRTRSLSAVEEDQCSPPSRMTTATMVAWIEEPMALLSSTVTWGGVDSKSSSSSDRLKLDHRQAWQQQTEKKWRTEEEEAAGHKGRRSCCLGRRRVEWLSGELNLLLPWPVRTGTRRWQQQQLNSKLPRQWQGDGLLDRGRQPEEGERKKRRVEDELEAEDDGNCADDSKERKKEADAQREGRRITFWRRKTIPTNGPPYSL